MVYFPVMYNITFSLKIGTNIYLGGIQWAQARPQKNGRTCIFEVEYKRMATDGHIGIMIFLSTNIRENTGLRTHENFLKSMMNIEGFGNNFQQKRRNNGGKITKSSI